MDQDQSSFTDGVGASKGEKQEAYSSSTAGNFTQPLAECISSPNDPLFQPVSSLQDDSQLLTLPSTSTSVQPPAVDPEQSTPGDGAGPPYVDHVRINAPDMNFKAAMAATANYFLLPWNGFGGEKVMSKRPFVSQRAACSDAVRWFFGGEAQKQKLGTCVISPLSRPDKDPPLMSFVFLLVCSPKYVDVTVDAAAQSGYLLTALDHFRQELKSRHPDCEESKITVWCHLDQMAYNFTVNHRHPSQQIESPYEKGERLILQAFHDFQGRLKIGHKRGY